MFSRFALASALVLVAFACGDGARPLDATGAGPNDPAAPGASSSSSGGASTDAATGPSDGCRVGDAICTAKDARRACVDDGKGGSRWVDETCAVGSGCFAGACTPGKCADECTLGDAKGSQTCAPFDVKTGKAAASDPAGKLHDRARGYLAWTKKGAMLAGGIGSARYADPPAYTQVTSMDGIGDSAIWTGAFLGAEALRLRATGAADARARVKSLVDTLHLWLNVAGEPGMLVRWAKESATTFPFVIGDYDCNDERVHCGVDHAGKKYDLVGHISRDQYQGVMFGLALAYDALGSADEATRAAIRSDVVTIAKELMKERTLPVDLTFDGVKVPTKSVTGRYMVVSPREMKNGAIQLRVDSASPTTPRCTASRSSTPTSPISCARCPACRGCPRSSAPRARSCSRRSSASRSTRPTACLRRRRTTRSCARSTSSTPASGSTSPRSGRTAGRAGRATRRTTSP